MQMPIPHNGPRGRPCTETRHGSPAVIMAAATLVPSETRTGLPLTVMEKLSLIERAWSSLRNLPENCRSRLECEIEP
jgi:hypothetical protein